MPHYLVSRVAEHVTRRAEEMKEAVRTLQDVGIPGDMSKATSAQQAALPAQRAQQPLTYVDLLPFDWEATLSRVHAGNEKKINTAFRLTSVMASLLIKEDSNDVTPGRPGLTGADCMNW